MFYNHYIFYWLSSPLLDCQILFLCLPFFFIVGVGFEFKALHLQSRFSTTWASLPFHFALIILEIGCCELFAWLASNYDPPDLSLPK
jgi:hypothetical protein